MQKQLLEMHIINFSQKLKLFRYHDIFVNRISFSENYFKLIKLDNL